LAFDAREYWNERHRTTDGFDGVGYLGLRRFNHWMYRLRARVLDRVLGPQAERVRGARVLDVGAGTGFVLGHLMSLSPKEIVAIDIAEIACARLRERFPKVEVRCIDLASAPEAEIEALGRFALITAMDVLFHVVEDAKYARTLQRIAQLLQPDGRLIFSENFIHDSRSGNAWAQSRSFSEIEQALAGAHLVLERRVPSFVIMNQPVDSNSRFLHASWRMIYAFARRSTLASDALGAALYPLDRVLTRIVKEGPTTEVATARRIG
jgi:2-polyprenyl-3-methyl-5-hydroxy-6-metoxy-1,4-benzoquinol methylase